MQILVDSSIWIDYFKSGQNSQPLDALLEVDQIVTNDIILAELIPCLLLKRHYRVIELLRNITLLPLTIDWFEIIDWQTKCLSVGLNGIGIPDLNIAQNSKHYHYKIYSLDKHYRFLNRLFEELSLFE